MNGISAYRKLDGLAPEEVGFLRALRGSVKDAASWLAYSDWLMEQGRAVEAWEAREKAGRCKLRYRPRHVPSGDVYYTGYASLRMARRWLRWKAAQGQQLVVYCLYEEFRKGRVKGQPPRKVDYYRPASEFDIVLEAVTTEVVLTGLTMKG
jgi:uncharacterized protein (TIGR02996 family)